MAPVPDPRTRIAASASKKRAMACSAFSVVLGLFNPGTTPKSPRVRLSVPVKVLVMASTIRN